jgi:Tfp pilus assembly protein PilE
MKHSFQIAHRKQAGITLVETAIALAIAAVVVSTAFAGFQANARRSEVRDNSQLISEMVADAKQLFGPTNRYSVLDTDAAKAARVIPNNLHTSTGAVNSYGGSILINGVDTTSNDYGMMLFDKVPRNQCADLALSIERPVAKMVIDAAGTHGATDGSTVLGLAASDASVTKDVGSDTADVAKVTTQCQAEAESQIAVIFGRN